MGNSPRSFAALFLVGGRARRFAGIAKSELVVDGATILERMLGATTAAARRVVVGTRPADADPLPDDVASVLEDPPGSGPARAVAAGLEAVPVEDERVVILPGDLPFLCPEALNLLLTRAEAAGDDAGAVFCDDAGRRQWLCGAWPTEAVRRNALKALPGDPARVLFSGIKVAGVNWDRGGPPPWFDCDTPGELEQARVWASHIKANED
ncbi:NTP transferase domain-containing protein [Glycomyces sp. L485]|uniref:molybdenum cofactor guanylyltransferase n=1 Tax=Glycomyces sp. L485 TaxID=2909235 RepID=UPI001F4B8E3E|nr:NTP transferase domain-containing protein [Glycomyces sp. L485]MCH7229547.1 NTP transferase domain-containing protein [Glycomyces sp. L485]